MDSVLVPLLIGVVAVVLIASGIALWARRRQAAKNARSLTRPPEDLRSLGISEIRAKPKAAPMPAAEPVADADEAYADEAYADADAFSDDDPEADAYLEDDAYPEDDASAEVEGYEGADAYAEAYDADAYETSEDDATPFADAAGPSDESWEDASVVQTPEDVRRALREEPAAAFEEDDAFEAEAEAFFEADDLDDVPVPDPRDFEGELDLPMPLPDGDLPLVRTPPSRALAHLVEAAGVALRAQTVALLRHDASALHFEVLALRSAHAAVVGAEAFPSAGSALRAVRGEELTLLKGADLDALGYYADASAIGRAYVQPLTREAAPSLLLVVDTAPEAPTYTPAEKDLLHHFGSLIAHLAQREAPDWFAQDDDAPGRSESPLVEADAYDEAEAYDEADAHDEAPYAEGEVDRDDAEEPLPQTDAYDDEATGDAYADDIYYEDEHEDEAYQDEASDDAPLDDEDAPPVARRVIVAEEMAHARAEGRPLALALVHRADAEAVAQQGAAAVAAAEAALLDHLEASLSLDDGRIEPFGELMYGVFYYGRGGDVEAWVDLVRTTPAPTGETLPVAIGVALLAERHDGPEAFRADAVQALADAYEAQVGCVILE